MRAKKTIAIALIAGSVGCKKVDCPALLEAAQQGDRSRIETLIARGTPVDCTDPKGHTSLHLAAIHDRREAAEALVVRGAALERLDADERTPLCEAAKHGSAEVAGLLLSRGADKEGACRGVAFTALHIAAGADAANVVKLLIANGAKVNARNVWDQTALHQAASEARSGVEVSHLLVDAGGELEIHDNKGFTALIVAAKHGNVALTRALLDRGANPNAATDNGKTALDHAKVPDVVALLEARGGRRGAAAAAPARPTVE